MQVVLPLLLIVCVVCSGCATTLYVIEGKDIFPIDKGTQCGDYKAEKNGWFLSDKYLKEVAEAKVR